MQYQINFCRLLLTMTALLFFAPAILLAETTLPSGTLNKSELGSMFFNKTVEVEFIKPKGRALLYFSPNGELKKVQDQRLYKGYWKVKKNGRLCTKYEDASWDCRIVSRAGEKITQYIVKSNNQHRHELTYLKFHQGKKLAELAPAPLPPSGTLSRKKVIKLFSDKTVESVTARKGRISQSYYGNDGTVEQLRNGARRFGKWRVTNNGSICLQMEDMAEKCRIIVEENGEYKKYIVKKNGHHQHSVSYRKFRDGKHL